MKSLSGKIQTVQGLIEPNDLGPTLSHEHVLWDAGFLYHQPQDSPQVNEISLENLEWLRRNSTGCLDNLSQTDRKVAISEVSLFKKAGGGAIVDMGCKGLHRDPEGLVSVSKATGVHIVMGAGYYVGDSHPEKLRDMSVKEIANEILHDITVGVNGTSIRSGVIGEIGCSYPFMETEEKVLEAAAEAQRVTGAAVNIHPGRTQAAPLELVDLFRGFGGDISRTAISHISYRHGTDIGLTIELAKTGCYIEYDSFGNYQNPVTVPEKTFYALTDWQRVQCIKELIQKGYTDKLLISHDVFNKTDLHKYGGFGYDYIHETVIPMMRMHGITDEEIHSMLVLNPQRFLQFT